MNTLLLLLIFITLLVIFPKAVDIIIEGAVLVTFIVICVITVAILALGMLVVM